MRVAIAVRTALAFGLCVASVARGADKAAANGRKEALEALEGAKSALSFVQRKGPRPRHRAALARLAALFSSAGKASGTDWNALASRAAALRRSVLSSHPALDFNGILFVERDIIGGSYYNGVQTMDQCYGHNARRGGGLYILRNALSDSPALVDVVRGLRVPRGTNAGMPLGEGTFMSPELSYDGRTILFAWSSGGREKWKRENRFNLFRVDVDGGHLARLTDGDHDDFDPCWLPDGDIVFISTRRGGFGRCHPRPVPTYTLWGMDARGRAIRCLSYHETNEWQPSVDNDGMLVYTRWDYLDRDAMIAIHPWRCYPDGRDPRALHGNYPLPLTTMTGSGWPDGRRLRPQCEHSLRAIPGSHRLVGVATPHHNESYGSLILVDPRVEDDNRMSQVKRLTPEAKFPEIEKGGLVYGTPWPLSEDLYLCNHKDTLALLYFPGPRGVLEVLYRKKTLRPIDPIPVRARPKPPVLPKHELTTQQVGTLHVQNVYVTDDFGQLPRGTKIARMRVVQVFPKTTPLEDKPRISVFTESLVRASLGTVPVEADGSVYCRAPSGKEVYFQLLDEKGMAVQSMRSGTYLHAGELLTCVGCHESRYQAPARQPSPRALARAPSALEPELAGVPGLAPREPVNFYRLVKPVFDARCVGCHRRAGKGPDMSYGSLRGYLFGFDGKWGRLHTASRSGGSRTLPGRFGARASRLYTGGYLTGTSSSCRNRAALTKGELRRVTLWLDLNSNELGAYHEVDRQRRGELVRPLID